MPTVADQDIRITSGDSESHRLAVYDALGNLVDLSAAIARYVAKSRETGALVIEKSTAIVANYPSSADELLTTFDPEDTAALAGQKLDHEWEIVDLAGHVSTVARGRLIISGDIA